MFSRTAAAFFPALLIFAFSCSDSSVQGKRPNAEQSILFIGNSFTSMNNLPLMFQSLAMEAGIETHIDTVLKNGARLIDHAADKEAMDKIQSRAWSFIVLQEQSQYPAYSDSRKEMKEGVRVLKEASNGTSAKTLLLMTWGYRNGDNLNAQDVEMRTFEGMQERLKLGYLEVGNELSVEVCPVGLAWLKARQMNPGLELWISDGIHPSVMGTYLTASCLYAKLLHRRPVESRYTASIDAEKVRILKRAAEQACLTQ
jgi:hypothetical protein